MAIWPRLLMPPTRVWIAPGTSIVVTPSIHGTAGPSVRPSATDWLTAVGRGTGAHMTSSGADPGDVDTNDQDAEPTMTASGEQRPDGTDPSADGDGAAAEAWDTDPDE